MCEEVKDLWDVDYAELSDEELVQHFYDCLCAHDWTFQMTEDIEVYRAGKRQNEHLMTVFGAVTRINKKLALELYYQESPFCYHHETDDIETDSAGDIGC